MKPFSLSLSQVFVTAMSQSTSPKKWPPLPLGGPLSTVLQMMRHADSVKPLCAVGDVIVVGKQSYQIVEGPTVTASQLANAIAISTGITEAELNAFSIVAKVASTFADVGAIVNKDNSVHLVVVGENNCSHFLLRWGRSGEGCSSNSLLSVFFRKQLKQLIRSLSLGRLPPAMRRKGRRAAVPPRWYVCVHQKSLSSRIELDRVFQGENHEAGGKPTVGGAVNSTSVCLFLPFVTRESKHRAHVRV